MGQSKWNEEKIIQTLRDFPKMEDPKPKEELYDQIQNRIGQREKKRKMFRFTPVFAAACILAIAAILSPAILNSTVFDTQPNQASQESESALPSSTKSVPEKSAPTSEKVEPAGPSEETPETATIEPKVHVAEDYIYHSGITAVPDDQQVVTIFYPDQEAMGVVPVSILAGKELSRVDAIQEALRTVDPEELGLIESGLESVKLAENQESNSLVVDIEPGSIQGSTGERIFVETVKGTAYSLGYETISFKSAGEKGYEFSHSGPIDTLAVEAPEKGVTGLLTDKGTFLLVNGIQLNGDIKPETIQEALHWMGKEIEGFGYQETIPKNVYIKEVTEDGSKVTIVFSGGTKLEDTPECLAMIDSILWTANQYGYDNVEVKNAPIDQIGPYVLTETLPVLKAPNVVSP